MHAARFDEPKPAGRPHGVINDLRSAWQRITGILRAQLGGTIYNSWFCGLELDRIDGPVAYLSVSTKFLRNWIRRNYSTQVLDALKTEFPEIERLAFSDRSPDGRLSPAQAKPLEKSTQRTQGIATPLPLEPSLPPVPPEWPSAFQDYRPQRLLVSDIQNIVADYYGFDRAALTSPQRTAGLVRARHVAMYLTRLLTKYTLHEIGRRYDRDHTVVLTSSRKIEALLKRNPALAQDIDILKEQCAIFEPGAHTVAAE